MNIKEWINQNRINASHHLMLAWEAIVKAEWMADHIDEVGNS